MAFRHTNPPFDIRLLPKWLQTEFQRLEFELHDYGKWKGGQWDDLRFPASGINKPGPAGAPTWDSSTIGYGFSGSAENDVQMNAQIPHSWKLDSALRPHIHVETVAGHALATHVWEMSYRWRNNGQTLTALTTHTLTCTPTSTACLQIHSFPEIDGTGKRASSILDIELARRGDTDSFAGVVVLKEFDIHYLIDSFGSDAELYKR